MYCTDHSPASDDDDVSSTEGTDSDWRYSNTHSRRGKTMVSRWRSPKSIISQALMIGFNAILRLPNAVPASDLEGGRASTRPRSTSAPSGVGTASRQQRSSIVASSVNAGMSTAATFSAELSESPQIPSSHQSQQCRSSEVPPSEEDSQDPGWVANFDVERTGELQDLRYCMSHGPEGGVA